MVVRIFSFVVAMVLAGGAWGQESLSAGSSPVRLSEREVFLQARVDLAMKLDELSAFTDLGHWIPDGGLEQPSLDAVAADLAVSALTERPASHELYYTSAFFNREFLSVSLCQGVVWRIVRSSASTEDGNMVFAEEFLASRDIEPTYKVAQGYGFNWFEASGEFDWPIQFELEYIGIVPGGPPDLYTRSLSNPHLAEPCENPETPAVE